VLQERSELIVYERRCKYLAQNLISVFFPEDHRKVRMPDCSCMFVGGGVVAKYRYINHTTIA